MAIGHSFLEFGGLVGAPGNEQAPENDDANCLADTGAVQSAVTVLRQAQQWHPDNFWINYELSDSLQRVGQPVEALRFRTAALALRPDSARTH